MSLLTEEQKEELEQLGINKATECQFVKYGFKKPKFECEILKETEDKFIGWIRDFSENRIFANSWNKKGISELQGETFNLTPIKKPWHDLKESIGKVIIRKVNSELFIFKQKYFHESGRYCFEAFSIRKMKVEKELICFNDYRLATKEEVLSLYKEDK